MGLFSSSLSTKAKVGEAKKPSPTPSLGEDKKPRTVLCPPTIVSVPRTPSELAAPQLLAALKRLVSVPLPTVGEDYDAALEYEQAEAQALEAISDAEFGKSRNRH